jgi:hypothetical protein
LRIELILDERPQLLHPGIFSSIVLSAAATGAVSASMRITKATIGTETIFPIISLFLLNPDKNSHPASRFPLDVRFASHIRRERKNPDIFLQRAGIYTALTAKPASTIRRS